MALGPGSRVGPYDITALIGEGGMGKVWRAHHLALKQDDAWTDELKRRVPAK